ncbi:MAG TPA: TerB family tellurite resistance protein [Candidatus Thermoplasmatota archaeon]|nr:TerB family tellurite resistance protein [Candidatus Thermoplasmatota archaeon]
MPKASPVPLSPQEALAAIASHCIEMDGMVTLEEHDALRAALGQVHLMGAPAQVREVLRRIGERVRRDGADQVLEAAIHSLPPTWRPPAYDVAMRLVSSDGDVAAEESALLARLRRDFRL